ncbi:Sepiapterin reductase [Echinococcus granulosus]|uniref:Sepiapterin reductase n=1 Tax=Echinococcus granulosus TaxID=6210 RepID=W6UEP7_ECHGR|nr:Sepiapterin reductase [Echinococcus granulosus]EUB59376.1 Sepiapterin reductase [Echinococcus granulosus]
MSCCMYVKEPKCTCGQSFREAAPWSNANCFVVVTGASRGFGRAFCIQLLREVAEPRFCHCPPAVSLTFFLLGRDMNALCETESEIIASIPENGTTSVAVYFDGGEHLDMNTADAVTLSNTLQPIYDAMAKCASGNQPQWNLLVNNAGTLGNIKIRADEHLSTVDLESYFRVNLFSQIILTNVFLHHVAPMVEKTSHPPTTILTISSLAAVKPLSHMLTYCCSKAARDMHLKCLVIDRPSISAFIYSPGPLLTAMYDQLEKEQGDPKARAWFKERREQGLVIQPMDSARMCVRWLRRQRFSSQTGEIQFPARVCLLHQADYRELWKGQHLDYFEARDLEEAEFGRIGL